MYNEKVLNSALTWTPDFSAMYYQTKFGMASPFGFGKTSNPFAATASPDGVLNTYCSDIQSGAYQQAYNQYPDKLKGEVSSAQFIQMWSGKFIDACVPGAIQITGNQASTTLSMHNGPANSTSTYQVTLRQDGANGWRIDSIQPQ